MEVIRQDQPLRRRQLLSVAAYERRRFFKRWNDLHQSEKAYFPLAQKLKLLLDTFPRGKEVSLPAGVEFISLVDEGYPHAFLELPQPPLGLFVQGKWISEERRVAMVGSRKPTPYARRLTRECARVWLDQKATLVSGGAIGIDGEVHETAVGFKGRTIVVFGGGHRHWHPRSHEDLFRRVLGTGGALVSEYPPFMEARPYHFPERNRLIAALGESLFLAQAHEKSGSLLTAKTALDLGREIWVLKPLSGDANYAGSHDLIEMGAKTLLRPQDLFSS